MKRIRATFIGQDTLGYEYGQEYELWIEALNIPFTRRATIRIHRLDNEGWCPYRNIETFLENWDTIRTMKEVE